ncbi:MAG: UDP-N-acetylglucosamine 2-epimerase (non-hydrolyzing) [Chloroflexota bacterium]
MKIAIILGTRPEIIKMSPIVRECERLNLDYFILHAGQHYSYGLNDVFFEKLGLPEPRYNLGSGSGSHAAQTAKILIGAEKVLSKDTPDMVLVEGDTNTVLAGALAAAKLHIKVGHVEAGLRSYNRRMPEEINRVLTDHCADYLFAPTAGARNNLLGEGISSDRIYVTGNTIVDAIHQNLDIARKKGDALSTLRLAPSEYFLVTLHREENVDDPKRLASIIKGLDRVASEFHLPVVYPIHPRSRKMLTRFRLEPQNLKLIEPLDFLDFLQLEGNARLILTDSGGVQEEACILGVPCVTLRDDTERPETIAVGANVLAGAAPSKIVQGTHLMLGRERNWLNPFGDGTAGRQIVKIITGAERG